MKKITIITGATASGKTLYSLEYCRNFEKAIIINADASAVYSSFPILTAQPSFAQKSQIPHFLFEVKKIEEDFSVATWLEYVDGILNNKQYQEFHKIIVGGTCMYIYLLINGLIKAPKITEDARKEAILLYNKIGSEAFFEIVQKKDASTKKDKQRLINNYALILQTGKSFAEWQKEPKRIFLKEEFDLIKINPPREEIYANCNARFLKMLENGAMQEVESAIQVYGSGYNFIKILCANEIKDYIMGKISKERMIEVCMQLNRNLAKSQITWLNNKL